MKFTIDREEMIEFFDGELYKFPKYTTQIINLANQNAQATRPKNVGQLSDMFPKYLESTDHPSIEGWTKYYNSFQTDSIDQAVSKIMFQLNNFKAVIDQIDENMVKDWVEDLIYNKTFKGLNYEHLIMLKLAEEKKGSYRNSTKEEESKGIDGYIDNEPYSIKPMTYKTKDMLSEKIEVNMVFYKETSTGLRVEVIEKE